MSGGHYDYLCFKFDDFASMVEQELSNPETAEYMSDDSKKLRSQFVAHLRLVAKAARAIEWVDSGDWGNGDEDQPIREAIGLDDL